MFSLSHEFIESIEFWLKLIGGLGTLIVFILGLLRYSKDKDWKRKEFVANEIEKFNTNHFNRNAMYMLDWGIRKIELFPSKSEYNDRFVLVNRKILAKALIPHQNKLRKKNGMKYSDEEVIIRDTFDFFLSNLERFEHFIENKLVDKEDFAVYLKYWISTISIGLEEDVKQILHYYIKFYKYDGVIYKSF
jgi:hypothetical protein